MHRRVSQKGLAEYQKAEHQIHDFSSALSELAAELRPAEMQSSAASAAGLGFVALQSSALLRMRARPCDLQLGSAALHSSALLHFTAQLCCFAWLSSAALHSSALLYLHSMIIGNAHSNSRCCTFHNMQTTACFFLPKSAYDIPPESNRHITLLPRYTQLTHCIVGISPAT